MTSKVMLLWEGRVESSSTAPEVPPCRDAVTVGALRLLHVESSLNTAVSPGEPCGASRLALHLGIGSSPIWPLIFSAQHLGHVALTPPHTQLGEESFPAPHVPRVPLTFPLQVMPPLPADSMGPC